MYIFGGSFSLAALAFYVIYFLIIMPRVKKAKEEQRRRKDEQEIKKQQLLAQIEKDKRDHELKTKQMLLEAALKEPRYCEYCRSLLPTDGGRCESCGALPPKVTK